MASPYLLPVILYSNKHKIPFEIDDGDYFAVSYYTWHIGHGYVRTWIPWKGGKYRQRLLTMQIFLMGPAPLGTEWDHIDRNQLNNKRNNLRAVSHAINKRNESPNRANVSGIRGVSQLIAHNGKKYWQVSIRDGKGNRISLGLYVTLEEAALARKKGEDRIWGNQR